MFQVSTFMPHFVTIVHPPECCVTMDMLFETELLFAWGPLADPHNLHEFLGRYVPFAPAYVEGFTRSVTSNYGEWHPVLREERDGIVQGVVLIGLSEPEIENLDQYERVPMHMQREKIPCMIGNLQRIVQIYLTRGSYLG